MKLTLIRPLYLLIAAMIISFTSGGASLTPVSAAATQKASWLWDTSLIKQSGSTVLTFYKNQGVNVIYLQINRKINVSYYKNFIRQATAQGIEVHALDGHSTWALTSQRTQLTTLLKWIENYQLNAGVNEKFKGIHVDIEPYLLPDWNTNQKSIISQWQSNVQYMVQRAAVIKLPIAADLPFWLHTIKVPDGTSTLSSWMLKQYNSVTLMSYRDTSTGIFNVAKTILEEGVALGKTVHTGVETNNTSEGDVISFYEEGASFMNQELEKLVQLASGYTSYGGIAVHDYLGWKSLVESSSAN
ncbi:hypothetical protein [Paenibacillus sp. YPG26]|uniref:hypothetical protein n=1 Tax=Paenibacillus sp. YPG26 TaxID=2878915 RepID=UPI00203FF636|nr:hypothetical protein [Paenibacillus sp. YPG26]USB31889.1 hypothetical protein LDO05_11070 [Paenibacillus sp. YPG26]